MARTKRRKRRSSKSNNLEQLTSALLRPELLGIILVLISAFTLLSLVTDSRGQITGAWIDILSRGVGIGVWGLPLVTGALGLWIVIRAIERMPDLPWQRPVGFAFLFLAFITGAALYVENDPYVAGGVLGVEIARLLLDAVGLWGAWAFITFIIIGGIVFLTDRLLLDTAYEIGFVLHDWWQSRSEERRHVTISPRLPMPSGRLPWWKRLRERITASDAPILEPPNLVRPEPRSPRAEARVRKSEPVPKPQSRIQESPTQTYNPKTMTPQSQPTTVAAENDLLSPRIVGGAQEWRLPELAQILSDWERQVDSDDMIRKQGRLIQDTLGLFGVPADFEGAYKGPAVTQYLIKPGYIERTVRGETKRVKVKVSKIAGLSNDLALALAAPSVRIEAPVPGTNYVGVEVPNHESNVVGLKELMESDAFQSMKGKLGIALGEDVKGQPIVSDLARMPHLLIAGATGSGKSVCINSIITCLLLTHTPDSLRMLMVDPKMVELSVYNGIPHLLSPVVTEVDRAAGILFWAVKEMERRYQLCSKVNARDIERYNAYLEKRNEKPLPYIVVVVDEMADLMMASPEEVEKHICRLAQMARAVGIHLIIATQRPSVDVITGLIKANFPARIAFAVSSQIDSRVILDIPGAERLLGRGDMLFMGSDASKLERIQGTFLSDDEINGAVRFWKGIRSLDNFGRSTSQDTLDEAETSVPADMENDMDNSSATYANDDIPVPIVGDNSPVGTLEQPALFQEIKELKAVDSRDELFDDAVRIVRESGRGSISLLQRKLRIGYNRSSRIVDQLEQARYSGPDLGGNQGRELLITSEQDENSQPEPPPRIIGSEDDDSSSRPRIWM